MMLDIVVTTPIATCTLRSNHMIQTQAQAQAQGQAQAQDQTQSQVQAQAQAPYNHFSPPYSTITFTD